MTKVKYKGRYNSTGIKIRELRVERGLSQKRLAEQLNAQGIEIDNYAIHRIENGERMVLDHEVTLFARFFGVDRNELYEDSTEE